MRAFAAASRTPGQPDDLVSADFAGDSRQSHAAYARDRLRNDGQFASQAVVVQARPAPNDVLWCRAGERTDHRGGAGRVPDSHIAERDRLRIDAFANTFKHRHACAQQRIDVRRRHRGFAREVARPALDRHAKTSGRGAAVRRQRRNRQRRRPHERRERTH